MSTITWAADVSGDFATASNWSPAKVPGSGDAAMIAPADAASFTVTSAVNEAMASLLAGEYATLAITAGVFVVTKSLAVDGTISAAAGAVLDVGPTIVNAGEIDLASTTAGKYSRLAIDSAVVSLTGAGVVRLAADGEITGAAISNELFNASTITGGGTLGAASMALVNAATGVIDSTAGMVIDTGAQNFVNDGLIESAGGGPDLLITSSVVKNRYGTIAANGVDLDLASTVIENGLLTSSGAAMIIDQDNGVILDGIGYGLTNATVFQFHGALGMEGTITNTGKFVETSGASAQITMDGNVSLKGAGTLAFNIGAGLNAIYSVHGKSYTLTNSGTITGHVLFGNGNFALTNATYGFIEADAANMRLRSNSTVVNAGYIAVSAGGIFRFDNNTIDNAGGFIAAGGTGPIYKGGGTVDFYGMVENAHGVIFGAHGYVGLHGATLQGGIIDFDYGGLYCDGSGGVIDLAGGAYFRGDENILRAAGDLLIEGGTLHGAGRLVEAEGGATITLQGVTLLGYGVHTNLLSAEANSAINIGNGVVVQTQGGVWGTNGTITLASTGDYTDIRVLAGGVTIGGGGGALVMSGAKARILGATASATLTNNGVIMGEGSIGVNELTLDNYKGYIEATGLLTVRDAAGHSITNTGVMEAAATGRLVLMDETINGAGKILAAGGVVILQDVDVIGGVLATTGTGRIKVSAPGGELDGSTGVGPAQINSGAVVQVLNGNDLTLNGAILNSGEIDTVAGSNTTALIIGSAGATLSGKGAIHLNSSLNNRVHGVSAKATLTNVDNLIDGAGQLGNGGMTLVNQAGGSIVGDQSVAPTINTGTIAITNAGLIENSGSGGTLVKSAIHNSGTLMAATTGTLNLAGTVTGSGVAQINGGVLYVQQVFIENVTFTGTTGVLKLGDSQAYTGKVTGLSTAGTNSLDLADIAFTSGVTKASYSGTTAAGVLTVTDGTHTAKIRLAGNYLGSTFTVSTDGHGGTKVVDPAAGPSTAPLAQAMAGFQHGPPAHLAATAAYSLPRFPVFHARA